MELAPRENHFDKRITVTTPLQKAGAYLVTAKVEGGNTSKIIVWVADTAIVKKTLKDETLYFVADAVTGAPVAKANLEFFGYKQRQVGNTNRFDVQTMNFAEVTDGDGQYNRPLSKAKNSSSGSSRRAREKGGSRTSASPASGRAATTMPVQQTKVFTITDRPVYRPGQKVKFKFWVRHAKYDQDDTSSFADQSFTVDVITPRATRSSRKPFTADDYGGLDGEFALPEDATLGVYQVYRRQPAAAAASASRSTRSRSSR